MQWKNKLFLLLMLTLTLFACKDEKNLQDLNKYVSDIRHNTAPKTTKVAKLADKLPQAVSYQASNTRSPFSESSYGVDSNVNNRLQSFPLNMLSYKGSATENDEIKGYIQAPDNKLYPVKLGDIIGDHYGKISRISSDRLEVEEEVVEEGKSISKRIITLQLKDDS